MSVPLVLKLYKIFVHANVEHEGESTAEEPMP